VADTRHRAMNKAVEPLPSWSFYPSEQQGQ
jgi:hypothetical protein